MDRAARKVSVYGQKIERASSNILRWNFVCDINDACVGIDREYYQNRIFHCILKIYPRSCGPDYKECYEPIVDFLFAGSQTAKTTQQTEGLFPGLSGGTLFAAT